ncbi:MAG: SDR family NAD(P)-dependent oxidoreductase [Bacteroidia bacterium]
MENILIITGGSKGIGRGIVTAYQVNGYRIFSIARTSADFRNNNGITQLQCDLACEVAVKDVLPHIFNQIDPMRTNKIVLVNNAGTLGEMGRVENLTSESISFAVTLNTITPLLLTSMFIRLTKNWTCERKIINISSGAAQNPYDGWSVYCATKAALDMMTKVVAAEQSQVENGVTILAIYPGVVDTEMQSEIRRHQKEDFSSIERFIALKESGSLTDPRIVGEKIYNIDQQDLENGTILRLE